MKSVLLCLAACSIAAWAQAPAQADKRGCTDSKVLSRMPGCVITLCANNDFNFANMPRVRNEKNPVEGLYEKINYRCPAEKSPVELGRNAEGALKNAGFQIHYTEVYGPGTRFWLTAQKGAQWVHVYTASGGGFELTTVKQKQMEQVMTASADGWAQQINQSGRVSIYGINFDTGKATIRPDSEPALKEVVKLLQTNPQWAMVVAGHTDNVGAKDMNLALSRQRAESVITWLSTQGIEKSRLVSAGFGDTRPLAENADDAGRQKNRRVDLVKLY